MTVPAEPSLRELIRGEIEKQGPIPFPRFMELALYHERWGYYRQSRDPFGVAGDYFTNSQLQPVFGRLVAQQIGRWREEMGSPEGFSVLELGPGRGETTSVLLDRLQGVPCIPVEYSPIDSGPVDSGPVGYGRVSGKDGPFPEHLTGVVFSNEFFDALPVHSVEKRGSGFVEHHVDIGVDGAKEEFRFVDGPPSDPGLESYLEQYAPGIADGQRIEINLAALRHLERIAAILDRGYVLTIDYGYTAEEIVGARRFSRGSLMSYRNHQASEDVLADAGSRDITAHVNFTALEQRGAELGLVSAGLQTQAQFLMEVGEPDQFASALEAGSEQESLRLRMQLKTLLFGLGETFRVLVQRKG